MNTRIEKKCQKVAETCTDLIIKSGVGEEDALAIVLNMLKYHSSLMMDTDSHDAFIDGLKALLRRAFFPNGTSQSSKGSPDLYLALVHVPTGDLSSEDIFDAYLRATCVAAGIRFDSAFMDRITKLFHQQRVKTNDA